MLNTKFWCAAACGLLLVPTLRGAEPVTVEGAPSDSGYNVGTAANLRAALKGVTGDPGRYAVFAEIQFIGTTAVTSVQLDRQGEAKNGEVSYEGGWPIPADAPTGVYSVKLKVEDRKKHEVAAVRELRGFAAYRKLVRISDVRLDKTFYTVGDTIQCAVALQNLTGRALNGLRVEFSNANYPWISNFSGEASLAGQQQENLQLGLKVLREGLDLPAQGEANLPMMAAGTARFLQGSMVAMLGAGGPARHAQNPPPEVDQYTVAVWNSDRTVLYDMQFSKPAIIRPSTTDLPKPYSNLAYTHPYNSDLDFSKYREFYPAGYLSEAILLDGSRSLFRPGEKLQLGFTLRNISPDVWSNAELHAVIHDPSGKQIHTVILAREISLNPGEAKKVSTDAWTIPSDFVAGTYKVDFVLASGAAGLARTAGEIAVNELPSSVLVVAPHEDDERSYAGLIRAAVEAGVPVHVLILTGGDVGECERYYFKPCGPNEAREFGQVRMEESAQALEHLGLARDKLSILGLPDGGSGEIWFHHLKVSDPYLSVYLVSDHAPYTNVVKPNLLYARDAVIAEIKELISDIHPAVIATPHPDERHVDHRVTNWLVIKACQELLREKQLDPATVVLADQAYGAGGYQAAPYRYEKAPVYLSGEAAALKQEMSWIYQSQDGNLAEGAKKNFGELPRVEMHYRILDWQEHAGWNE